MISKKVIIPIVAVFLVVGAAVLGVSQAHAQTSQNPFSGLVQMIAQKFGLDQNQVQSAVNQYQQQQRQNMQQNLQQRQEDRLNKLVQDGKINADQKQAILNELAALKSKYNPANFKNMTADQRKQQFQAQQAEIKAWAQSQNIDLSYIMSGFGMGGMKGFRGGNWLEPKPSPSPTP